MHSWAFQPAIVSLQKSTHPTCRSRSGEYVDRFKLGIDVVQTHAGVGHSRLNLLWQECVCGLCCNPLILSHVNLRLLDMWAASVHDGQCGFVDMLKVELHLSRLLYKNRRKWNPASDHFLDIQPLAKGESCSWHFSPVFNIIIMENFIMPVVYACTSQCVVGINTVHSFSCHEEIAWACG